MKEENNKQKRFIDFVYMLLYSVLFTVFGAVMYSYGISIFMFGIFVYLILMTILEIFNIIFWEKEVKHG